MSASQLGLGQLVGLFGVVSFGAVLPVVPTGAAVSVAAVVSVSDNVLLLLVVVLIGAAGAYAGDVITYAAMRFASPRLTARVRWLRASTSTAALNRFHEQIAEHELRTLLLSRLVPGGRIPVLLAVSLGGYPLRRFASADLAAALLWSAVYSAIGLVGRLIFPEEWESVLAAIVMILLISALSQVWHRHHSTDANSTPLDSGCPQGAPRAPE